MVEFVERYLDDERLHEALMGQGVIGTNATPHEPGPPRFIFTTRRAAWAAFPGCGATSRAGWAGSRFSWRTSRAMPAPWSPPECR